MPWVYSNTSGTPTGWAWSGLNTNNQHAAALNLPSACAVTQLKAFAAGYNTGVVATRLCLWVVGGALQVQTASFDMADGDDAAGEQYWYTKSVTPKVLAAGNYWVGLYRNPKESHVFGTMDGASGYRKTNTAGWPAVTSMSGYNTDSDDEPSVGAFYITKPEDPTAATATRVSDTKQTITWTNNKDSDQPYDNVYIERYDNVTGTYYTKATLSGSTTSYSDTTTTANRKYRYRIRAKNAAGYSSYDYTDYINTTPAKPTSVAALRVGTTVSIIWGNPAANEESLTIQRKTSADNVTWGAYSTLSSSLAVNATSYIDSSPASYNQYQVRASCTDPTLNSDYVASNIVQTLRYPNVTSNLQPSDYEGVDIAGAIPITWQHNPADGSAQTHYSIRFREYGEAWSLYINKAVRVDSYSNVSTAAFSVGKWEYEVRTWGAATTGGESGDGSGYYEGSGYELGSFTLATKPEGTIITPNIDEYTNSILVMEWTYSQDESNEQTEYIAKLYNDIGDLLESKTNSSDETSITFDYNLEDGKTYTVTLQVKEENGLWSAETSQEFVTAFFTPPVPTFTLELNESQGSIVIDIVNPSPEGVEVEASYNMLYRSVDNGEYELVLTSITPNSAVTDYIPTIGGNNSYYVVAVSEIPSISTSLIDSLSVILTGRYFLNSGNGFGYYANLRGDTQIIENLGNETVLKRFEGRTYPVKYESSKLDQNINFSCDLPNEDYTNLKVIVEDVGEKYYRDYTGRRFSCDIVNNKFARKDNQAHQFSCNITRVEGD